MFPGETGSGRKLVGIVGYPPCHRLCFTILQVAFEYHYLPVTFTGWAEPLESAEPIVEQLREQQCWGALVSSPFREIVMPRLDKVDGQAARIGAVDVVVNRGGRLMGYNTEMAAFAQFLANDVQFDPYGQRAVILGSGDTAQAVLMVLLEAGVDSVTVMHRHPERTAQMIAALGRESERVELTAPAQGDRDALKALAHCDLVINAAPVGACGGSSEGGWTVDVNLIAEDALICDLGCGPPSTRPLEVGRLVGRRIVDSVPMVVNQAALAFELWTGERPPVGLMLDRARRMLG